MANLSNRPLFHTKRSKSNIIGLIIAVILQVAIILLALTVLGGSIALSRFDRVKVDGHSMNPTLHNNQILLMRPTDNIRRDDIIVFQGYNDRGSRYNEDGTPFSLIKRVVAVGGDTIRFSRDNSGVVFLYLSIDGGEFERQNEEAFILSPMQHRTNVPYFELDRNFYIEDYTYFTLGDNRNNSRDSRNFGPVPKDDITAKVVNAPQFVERIVLWLS